MEGLVELIETGIQEVKLERYEDALRHLDDALNQADGLNQRDLPTQLRAQAFAYLGHVVHYMGIPFLGRLYCDEAIRMDPNCSKAYYFRALMEYECAIQNMGSYSEIAKKYFTATQQDLGKAIEFDPEEFTKAKELLEEVEINLRSFLPSKFSTFTDMVRSYLQGMYASVRTQFKH